VGDLGGSFTGHVGEMRAALAGRLTEFLAAFSSDVSRFPQTFAGLLSPESARAGLRDRFPLLYFFTIGFQTIIQ